MPSLKQIIFASMFVCFLLATATAQDNTSASAQRSSPTITAAAAGDRVRMQAVQRSTENSSRVTPQRSAYCGAKRKSTRTASRRLVHSRANTKSGTLSSGL